MSRKAGGTRGTGHWEEPGTTEGLSRGSCSHRGAQSLPETTPQAERDRRNGLASPWCVPCRFLQGSLVSDTQLEAS